MHACTGAGQGKSRTVKLEDDLKLMQNKFDVAAKTSHYLRREVEQLRGKVRGTSVFVVRAAYMSIDRASARVQCTATTHVHAHAVQPAMRL